MARASRRLTEVFDLVKRLGADHVRFNIETKITPTSGSGNAGPGRFRGSHREGRTRRRSVGTREHSVLRLAYPQGDASIAPEIERVCLTAEALTFDTIKRGEPGPSPWLAELDIDDVAGSVPRLVQAAGCATWSPLHRNAKPGDIAAAKALGLKVIPWTVNDRADMERLIALGVDGLITDYPDRLRAVMAEKNLALPPQVKAP